MRIALCLSGLPRCYDYKPETLLNLFHPYTVDVFCHLWDDHLPKDDCERLQNIWQPKKSLFEKQELYRNFFDYWTHKTEHLKAPGRYHSNTFPMWYSIYKANELKSLYEQENDFVYDVVCRARTDVWARTNWHSSLERIQHNKLIVIHERHYDGYNDTMAMGTSETMNKYCNLWRWFPVAVENSVEIGYETMLKEYIDQWVKLEVEQSYIETRIMRPGDLHKSFEEIQWNANTPPPNHELIQR